MSFQYFLIHCFLPQYPSLSAEQQQIVMESIHQFIRNNLTKAPFHIRIGEKILRSLFYIWLRINLVKLGPKTERTECAIAKFESLSSATRAIVRLHRSFIVLAFYEHPIVLHALNVAHPQQHQQHKREQRMRLLASETI